MESFYVGDLVHTCYKGTEISAILCSNDINKTSVAFQL